MQSAPTSNTPMIVKPSSGGAGYHKKGGIIKAQNGVLMDPISVTAKGGLRHQIPYGVTLGPAPEINRDTRISNSLAAHNARMQMNIPMTQERANGVVGQPDKKLNLNLNKDMILGGLDYLISKSAINKAADLQKKGIRAGMIASQEAMPNEFYSR